MHVLLPTCKCFSGQIFCAGADKGANSVFSFFSIWNVCAFIEILIPARLVTRKTAHYSFGIPGIFGCNPLRFDFNFVAQERVIKFGLVPELLPNSHHIK